MPSHPTPTPSFRTRLRLFFLIIVVVPMVAVAFVLADLVSDSQEARLDAQLSQAQQSAQGQYAADGREAGAAARTIGTDAQLAAAIRERDGAAIRRRLRQLAATT